MRQSVPLPVHAVTLLGKIWLPGCQKASNRSHCASCIGRVALTCCPIKSIVVQKTLHFTRLMVLSCKGALRRRLTSQTADAICNTRRETQNKLKSRVTSCFLRLLFQGTAYTAQARHTRKENPVSRKGELCGQMHTRYQHFQSADTGKSPGPR